MTFSTYSFRKCSEFFVVDEFPGASILCGNTLVGIVLLQSGLQIRRGASVIAACRSASENVCGEHGDLWRSRRDLNPQPSDPKSDALSVELRDRRFPQVYQKFAVIVLSLSSLLCICSDVSMRHGVDDVVDA